MTEIKTASSCIISLALLGALLSCVPVRPQPDRSKFLPPAPAAVAPQVLDSDPPPPLEARVELRSSARTLANAQGPRANRLESRLREAQWHFQEGRRHYQDGDFELARREFDRAVDVLLAIPERPAALNTELENLVETIHRMDLAGLGSGDAQEPAFEKSPLEDIPQMTFPFDPRLKNKVREEVRATASQLPLDVNDAVLSYIKYFSTERGRRILVSGMRRAGRYRPLIQRILDEEGIPQELIFLAQAESGFMPRAVSRKKCAGMWQFLMARGREYELWQSPYADDRLDPEKATRAAARHLRDLYQRYGDWYLAMAAYNGGPGLVDRAVERTGYADFWEFRRRNVLPRETANYIPIILAMTIMAKNAREHGLEDIEPDAPLDFDVLEIAAPTHLQLVADLAECPVSQIRGLNPALLKDLAPAGWHLRVPRKTAVALNAVLESIPAAKRSCWRVHRVGEGDTLAAIARRYRVSEAAVRSANPDLDGALARGVLLVVPAVAQPRPAPGRAASRPVQRNAAAKGTSPAKAKTVARKTAPARRGARAIAYNVASPSRHAVASVKR